MVLLLAVGDTYVSWQSNTPHSSSPASVLVSTHLARSVNYSFLFQSTHTVLLYLPWRGLHVPLKNGILIMDLCQINVAPMPKRIEQGYADFKISLLPL